MKKVKKKAKYNANSAIRSAIRRAFSRSPVVQEVLNKAKTYEPKYNKDGTLAKKPHVWITCAVCGRKFKSKHIAADHVIPVIDIEHGFQGWDKFVERLGWDKPENLQPICNYKLKYMKDFDNVPSCHYLKTQSERKERTKKDFQDVE